MMNEKPQITSVIPHHNIENENSVSSRLEMNNFLSDGFSVKQLENDILPKIVEISQRAGTILQNYAKNTILTVLKNDGSPVTPADEASDDFIFSELKALTPNIAYVSEERYAKGSLLKDETEPFWLVDPLDGTQDYINKTGDYAICIALIIKNKPVLGVISAPDHNRTFAAVVGGNAYEIKIDGKQIRLKHALEMGEYCPIRPQIAENDSELLHSKAHFPISVHPKNSVNYKFDVRIVHSRHRPPNLGAMFGMYVPATSIWRPVGSALKFGLLAAREVDIYACKAGTAPWDTAAGEALLKTLGGRIATISGAPLEINNKGFEIRNPEFLAFAPGYTPERL